MPLNQIKMALYALVLTNKYGLKLRKTNDPVEITKLRLEYAEVLLSKLSIDVEVIGKEKIEQGVQYLIISNHRSIIDPLVIEIALKNKGIHSLWIAKKELYNSFFFGVFTRNSGSILLDRESSQMGSFFNDIKAVIHGYESCIDDCQSAVGFITCNCLRQVAACYLSVTILTTEPSFPDVNCLKIWTHRPAKMRAVGCPPDVLATNFT